MDEREPPDFGIAPLPAEVCARDEVIRMRAAMRAAREKTDSIAAWRTWACEVLTAVYAKSIKDPPLEANIERLRRSVQRLAGGAVEDDVLREALGLLVTHPTRASKWGLP